MSERSALIAKLLNDRDYRANYIRAKLDVLVPSQLRALRLHKDLTQPILAEQAGMKQSRISAMETPGRTNFNLETLVRMAATLNVGLMVKFVPFSEMLRWENHYSQDTFDVTPIDNDVEFIDPAEQGRQKVGVLTGMQTPNVSAVIMPSRANEVKEMPSRRRGQIGSGTPQFQQMAAAAGASR
jgi:transcriptional regulator with XRE-family HTH domain